MEHATGDEPQRTVVDGGTVAWLASGDPQGRPVVWCHGGLSSRLDARLAEPGARQAGVCLISIDRPGIGLSTLGDVPTLARWPRIVGAVMDRLGHRTFSVAGWSAGGPFALACAHVLGDRIEATATIAGVVPLYDRQRRRELGLVLDRMLLRVAPTHPTAARAIVRVAATMPDGLLRRSLLDAALPAERVLLEAMDDRELVGFVREAVRNGGAGVAADYATIGRPWGFEPESVHAPVTVWHGEDDPLVPLSHGRLLSERLPQGELRALPGGGHFLPVTHAAQIFGVG